MSDEGSSNGRTRDFDSRNLGSSPSPSAINKLADWRWRLNHLYKIKDKKGRLITFKENGIQRAINNCRAREKDILKARQFGVTTNELIKQLDYVAFHHNKTACILAHEQGTLESIFEKVRLAHKHMPDKLRPILDKGGGSKYKMRFPELNSEIYADIEVRGGTNHWLHISEAAFADQARIKATLETVPPSGIVTRETTANGMGNHFYKRWIDKEVTARKLFFPWFFHEEYKIDASHINELTNEEKEFVARVADTYQIAISYEQIAFRRKKQKDLGDLFQQEYPEDDVNCFLASGAAAMDLRIVKKLIDESPDPLEIREYITVKINDKDVKLKANLKIYKKFDSHKVYACGADTAEGLGGDRSVGILMEADTREVVATIHSNKLKPREFAYALEEMCRIFTKNERVWPLLAVERNNHGHAVLLELEDHIVYPNLYYSDEKKEKPGWITDKITRPIMVDAFIDGVENETIIVNSRDILSECLTLIDNEGKIEAEEGENDDFIIATAIAVQMCIQSYGQITIYDNLSSKILV